MSEWMVDRCTNRQMHVCMHDSDDTDVQAEAEEAERRARIQMEIKKSLTHILLDVTDDMFGKTA